MVDSNTTITSDVKMKPVTEVIDDATRSDLNSVAHNQTRRYYQMWHATSVEVTLATYNATYGATCIGLGLTVENDLLED